MKSQVIEKGKVYVGMSGGVDSSVSAALLKRAGYEVTGVFIKVWTPPFMSCTWRDDRLDAMRVCAHLGIPFVTLDLEKEYKREVVDYMITEYKAGRTPNPDVMCNRHVKFGAFYDWALKNGADYIATGHYARITSSVIPVKTGIQIKKIGLDSRLHGNDKMLAVSTDKNKDQSYFLWTLTQAQLAHTLFPVGGMQKPEVRRLAKRFGLPTAEKKDSQGLCFLGKVDMKEFLRHFIKTKHGDVLDENGEIIGMHDGVALYTIGQRIGFTKTLLSPPLLRGEGKGGSRADEKSYYVIDKNIKRNTVTVAHKSPTGEIARAVKEVVLGGVSWIGPVPRREVPERRGTSLSARVRYRQPLQKVRIKNHDSRITIQFETPQIAASGQSVVFYNGDECLGGGIIV